MHHLDALGRNVEHLGDDLRVRSVGALPHVNRAAVKRHTAIGGHVDDRDRGGGRDRGLEADRDAAPAFDGAIAALERPAPVHAQRDAIEHRRNRSILHQGAGRLRAAVAQEVLAPKLDRVELERARHHVGVALIGPDELRDAEAAQRPRRSQVGVERIGIDRDVIDVVGARRREAGFLRDARADIRIGAAVPPHLAFARGDAAVLDARLDAERAGVLGERIELLLHGERDLHWAAHQQRERSHQCLELDVELAAEAAAEIRHPHAHFVLRPAEQARDLDAHERR